MHIPDQLPDDEQRFRTLIEHSADGIVLIDAGALITYVTPSANRLLGYAPAAVVGRDIFTFIHPDDQAAMRARFAEVLASGVSGMSAQCRVRHADASWRWVDVAPNNLLDEPSVRAIVLTYRDITVRKRRETQVQLLADASRVFAEAGADEQKVLDQVARTAAAAFGDRCSIFLLFDNDRRLRLAELHGVDDETGAVLRKAIEEVPVAEQRLVKHVLNTGEPVLLGPADLQQLRGVADPAFWPVLDRMTSRSSIIAPLRVQERSIGMLYVSRYRPELPPLSQSDLRLVQDLADRAALAISNARLYSDLQVELARRTAAEASLQLAHDDLARSEREFRSLAENALVGISRTTRDGEILYANDALAHMLEYESAAEMIGIHVKRHYAQ